MEPETKPEPDTPPRYLTLSLSEARLAEMDRILESWNDPDHDVITTGPPDEH
jgi:hypothetical protein